jgi:hypothetical protein
MRRIANPTGTPWSLPRFAHERRAYPDPGNAREVSAAREIVRLRRCGASLREIAGIMNGPWTRGAARGAGGFSVRLVRSVLRRGGGTKHAPRSRAV